VQFSINNVTTFCVLIFGVCALESVAQSETTTAADADLKLFAVEVTTGPGWDDSKAPNEQAFFKEHSANLKRLRGEGHIIMGARYSDKGLLIFSALSMDDVRAMMDQDPSMTAGTFVYAVHAFNVFYPGLVQTASNRP